VLSRDEVEAILEHLQPPYRLVVLLLYGCGLRLTECAATSRVLFSFSLLARDLPY